MNECLQNNTAFDSIMEIGIFFLKSEAEIEELKSLPKDGSLRT